jgi:hypothetical protein
MAIGASGETRADPAHSNRDKNGAQHSVHMREVISCARHHISLPITERFVVAVE